MSPETKEVLAIARQWHDRAVGHREIPNTEIPQFITLWIAFNALYALECDSRDGDHMQVLEFAKWPPACQSHVRGLTNESYIQAIAALSEHGVYNFRKRTYKRITDASDLTQVLEAVYQVRNNLFHGRKSPQHMRDLTLVRAAATILLQILSSLIVSDDIWLHSAA